MDNAKMAPGWEPFPDAIAIEKKPKNVCAGKHAHYRFLNRENQDLNFGRRRKRSSRDENRKCNVRIPPANNWRPTLT
jgi:hypothetical protein